MTMQLAFSNYRLPEVKKDKITSERQSVVKEFVDRLNYSRKDAKLRPLTARFIAIKMSHLSVPDMYFLLSTCKDAKNFSKMWWWSLRPQDDDSVTG